MPNLGLRPLELPQALSPNKPWWSASLVIGDGEALTADRLDSVPIGGVQLASEIRNIGVDDGSSGGEAHSPNVFEEVSLSDHLALALH